LGGSLQSLFQLSTVWPPTVLTGVIIWLGFVLLSLFYLYYYKRRIKFKGNATVEFGLESFALRTFAIAVSFSVLIIQAAGVNLLAPLGSGVEQLYFILGLLASTGILVADLLRKLDSFVRAAPKPDEPESTESRISVVAQVPKLSYRVTQTTTIGTKRQLPSVGFTIANVSDAPARFRVFAEIFLNGESFGYPSAWTDHYTGKRIWNLNAGRGLADGNFTLPFENVKKSDTLTIVVTVVVIGQDEREIRLLPLGWTYMHEENEWYFEPAPNLSASDRTQGYHRRM